MTLWKTGKRPPQASLVCASKNSPCPGGSRCRCKMTLWNLTWYNKTCRRSKDHRLALQGCEQGVKTTARKVNCRNAAREGPIGDVAGFDGLFGCSFLLVCAGWRSKPHCDFFDRLAPFTQGSLGSADKAIPQSATLTAPFTQGSLSPLAKGATGRSARPPPQRGRRRPPAARNTSAAAAAARTPAW